MVDIKTTFERQARWQHSRVKLSWTEKLRMAEILREAALSLRSNRMKSEVRPARKAGVRNKMARR